MFEDILLLLNIKVQEVSLNYSCHPFHSPFLGLCFSHLFDLFSLVNVSHLNIKPKFGL